MAWQIANHQGHNRWTGSNNNPINRIITRAPTLQLSSCLEEDEEAGDFGAGNGEPSGVVMQDLTWRVEKLRLEEQNQQRFLKSMPRFLPYEECRKWVQAFGRWYTEDDWKEWIAMGEKRNSYIPSEPDEYYGRLGQWISWDHFLREDPSD